MTQPRNFGYGEEEQMLREESRKFFKRNSNEQTLMKLVADNPDPERAPESLWDRDVWQQMVDLGWTTVAVPEEAGGMGMSAVAVATLVEEAGRAAFPSPMIATINATYVLAACGTGAATSALAQIAEGKTASLAVTDKYGSWESADTDVTASESGKIALDGTAWFVQDARKADFFVVKARTDAGVGLYRVPAGAPGVTVIPDSIIELTRDQAHVEFKGITLEAGDVLAEPGRGASAYDSAVPAILAMVSADMCGAAEWQLQTTVEYAKVREQFGRQIGFFQAVKHPIVNMMIMIDEARSLMYNAACAIDHQPGESAKFAHMAKISASDMAAFCSSRSVQFHGGMGFTWECYVHLYFKRQIHNQVLYGDAAYHRAKLADLLMGPITG